VRAGVAAALGWLGVRLDDTANAKANGESAARISDEGSRAAVWVIPTDEDLMIARHTRQLLG
jgi:acetate kinase